MILGTPFVYCALQEERDEIVTWFVKNEGMRQSDVTPRGTIWYSGPRWVVALAYGSGQHYHHHYKVVIWDDELAAQFGLRFGLSSYHGVSEVSETEDIKIYDAMLDAKSEWSGRIRDILRAAR